MDQNEDRPYLGTMGAARAAGCCERTVLNATLSGALKVAIVTDTGHRIYRLEDVLSWAHKRSKE